MKTETSELKIKASAKYINMSPHKIRRVTDRIRGRSYEQALMVLEFMPYHACNRMLQLLCSAAANASHNFGLSKNDSFVSQIQVDEGTSLKRFQPRAQGRAYPIRKPTCHVTIMMEITTK
uniref:ribosomal protein L22 n=1 Tax=Pallavicinia lyellii TaxID=56939 RepID=UPI001D12340A|nr:ribosomal protein L22 [Pallavicinia lyellii]QZZ24703.1 ribosomal protein L22 [Pallavicinia lyellii]QZZ24787.1 ribosomal protein L22 [Pallavicinia lyellii]